MDQNKPGSLRNWLHLARQTGDLFFALLISNGCIDLIFWEANSMQGAECLSYYSTNLDGISVDEFATGIRSNSGWCRSSASQPSGVDMPKQQAWLET